jgi:hypothetical protein
VSVKTRESALHRGAGDASPVDGARRVVGEPSDSSSGIHATGPVRRRRRWGWMTVADHRMLVALDEAGRSDAADAMEALIRSQRDLPDCFDHVAHELPESELAGGSVEWIASLHAANSSHGAGGGRRRRQEKSSPEDT